MYLICCCYLFLGNPEATAAERAFLGMIPHTFPFIKYRLLSQPGRTP
jgi:hypothetical protein